MSSISHHLSYNIEIEIEIEGQGRPWPDLTGPAWPLDSVVIPDPLWADHGIEAKSLTYAVIREVKLLDEVTGSIKYYKNFGSGVFVDLNQVKLVIPMFGSEPQFEPEPTRTGPRFRSGFKEIIEPNPRSRSRFREHAMGLNLSKLGSNQTFLGGQSRQSVFFILLFLFYCFFFCQWQCYIPRCPSLFSILVSRTNSDKRQLG